MTGTHVTGAGPPDGVYQESTFVWNDSVPCRGEQEEALQRRKRWSSLACLTVLGCILLQAPSLLDDRVSENGRQQQCVEGGEDGTGPNCSSFEVALAELVLGSEAET